MSIKALKGNGLVNIAATAILCPTLWVTPPLIGIGGATTDPSPTRIVKQDHSHTIHFYLTIHPEIHQVNLIELATAEVYGGQAFWYTH